MTGARKMGRKMHWTTRFGTMAGLVAIAACRPPTIVRDPVYPPGLPVGGPAQPPPPALPAADPALLPLSALQANLIAQAGSDTVRFDRNSYVLNDAARATLTAQAVWLRAHPTVRAKIEGHADTRLTREHALALGERRAAAVRNFLLAQGLPPQQLTVVSWGKERPAVGAAHEATWLQNSRVVTVLTR